MLLCRATLVQETPHICPLFNVDLKKTSNAAETIDIKNKEESSDSHPDDQGSGSGGHYLGKDKPS